MDTQHFVRFCLSDYGIERDKVIGINVLLRGDWDDRLARYTRPFPYEGAGAIYITEYSLCSPKDALYLVRKENVYPWDSMFMDRTGGYNRGWIIITYYV